MPGEKRKSARLRWSEDAERFQIDPSLTSMASLVKDRPRGKLMSRTREDLQKGVDPLERLRRADAPTLDAEEHERESTNTYTSEPEHSSRPEKTPRRESSESDSAGPSGVGDENQENGTTYNPNRDESRVHTGTADDGRYDDNDEHDGANPTADAGFDDLDNIQSSSHGARIRWDYELGDLVLDESTTHINREQEHEVPENVIEENTIDALVNSSTWLRKRQAKRVRWSKAETDRFYELYQQHGDDYECIARRMKRDRKQIKSKAMTERKTNPQRMQKALNSPMPIKAEELKRDLGIDISGPVPVDPTESLSSSRPGNGTQTTSES